MTKRTQEILTEARKIIMDEILDQRAALHLLGLLEDIKGEIQMSQERVSGREKSAEDSLMELKIKHDKACNLLGDFAKVVEHDRGADYHLLYQYKEFLEK